MSVALERRPALPLVALVGNPNCGKTALFNLLTGANVETSRFEAGRAELHTGVARVPDDRVTRLAELFKPKKPAYATFEVVDLAGIARGERSGLEAKEFRNADALLHVVRAFPDATGAPADPHRQGLAVDRDGAAREIGREVLREEVGSRVPAFRIAREGLRRDRREFGRRVLGREGVAAALHGAADLGRGVAG
jgi:hypothetical protein